MKNKDEQIKRLCKHNHELLNGVNKRQLHEFESKNRDRDISAKIEEEICKKDEESLNIDDVKLEMQYRIEEGCKNLIYGIIL